MVLALTLAKNGVPVRIIEKDLKFHTGQRGAGLQPRTLELYSFLGVLPDILEGGSLLVKRCIYEMPEGRNPVKTFDISPYEDPTPDVPYVSRIVEVHLLLISSIPMSSDKPLDHWTRPYRGDIAFALGQIQHYRRAEHGAR